MVDVGDDTGTAFLGKSGSGFDFRQHGARFEIAIFGKVGDFFGGYVFELGLVRCAEVGINIWYGCYGNEDICAG